MSRSLDTSKDARRRQIEAIRALAPTDRVRIADAMSTEVRALAEAGIRRRHPDASPEQVAEELADLMLGRRLASKPRGRRLIPAR